MSDTRLYQHIQAALKERPYLTFQSYMELALYHPKWGYYMQKDSPIGRDFVTAPLLSPYFAKAIGKWLEQQGVNKVLEIGAGNGALATQLQAIMELDYYILERNALDIPGCKRIEEVGRFEGAIIANELLDALPFQRFCWNDELLEFVVVDNNGLEIQLMPSQAKLPKSIMKQLDKLPRPYLFEYCDYEPLFTKLQDVKGPILLIDYGYIEDFFHPDRMLGTMMCYHNQKVVPFALDKTGSVDITSAVNWGLAEEAANQCGIKLNNIGPQSDFMLSMLSSGELDTSVLPLLYEHEMGQFVKVSSWYLG